MEQVILWCMKIRINGVDKQLPRTCPSLNESLLGTIFTKYLLWLCDNSHVIPKLSQRAINTDIEWYTSYYLCPLKRSSRKVEPHGILVKLGIHIVHDMKVILVHLLSYFGHNRRDTEDQLWGHQRWACLHFMARIRKI